MMTPQFRPARLEEMTEVECSRLFLWQFMLARRHNHLAHQIFATGFRLIESLRAMPPAAESLSYETRLKYAEAYDPWLSALLAVAYKLEDVGSSPETVKKVKDLHERTIVKYAMLTMQPLPADMREHESPPPTPTENASCVTAPTQVATLPSPTACSPAELTGSSSPPASAMPSGPPTMLTARVATESMNSDEIKRLSSQQRCTHGIGKARRGGAGGHKRGKA